MIVAGNHFCFVAVMLSLKDLHSGPCCSMVGLRYAPDKSLSNVLETNCVIQWIVIGQCYPPFELLGLFIDEN